MTQENKQVEPIKEYYIAYFDLLGYKKFFQSYPDKVEDFLLFASRSLLISLDGSNI